MPQTTETTETTETTSPTTGSTGSPRERLRAWIQEFVQFGLVGATAFVVDATLFNVFQHGPLGFLAGHPNTANVASATIATIYSWIANRLWTYRGRTQENTVREALLFAFANIGGIGITQFCLLFTHHILGLTSPLADNVAAYVVGFGLGTAFRFLFYHYIVFTGRTQVRPACQGAVTNAAVGGIPEVWDEADDGAAGAGAAGSSDGHASRG